MTKDDFKVGTFFLYSGNPEDTEGDRELIGLGEVIEVIGNAVSGIEVKIKWLWSPADQRWTTEDWYHNSHRQAWEMFCVPITSELEKLKLFLKYNFG
jgi:hypothetical protein